MLAIEVASPGPPSVLKLVERPKPEPGPADVLIRVDAAGVSRADVWQRQGNYPPPPGASDILGLDVAGTIVAAGESVRDWKTGDRVCALVSGGGYAEFCAAPAVQVLPIPQNWSAAEVVTLPENLFTVYDNLVTRARLKAGEKTLIHGGTSGIGSMAIMLSRELGAIPYATAGSDEKCAACLSLGAERAFNYRTEDFVQSCLSANAGNGVDVVLDIVGGKYLEKNIDVLALEGRLSLVATAGGSSGTLPIGKLMHKRGTIVASTLRARSVAEKGRIAELLRKHIWPVLPSKRHLRPLIDSTFPFRDAHKAHERMESGMHIGKIVLVVDVHRANAIESSR
jgi:putative PIG3 family NAD(P)H quinone oxidoreductase